MTIAPKLDSIPDLLYPPGDYYSNEPPLESTLHLQQLIILLESLKWHWKDKNDFCAAGNLTIFYSSQEIKPEEFRGPDFFLVLETEKKHLKSWVVWEENGKYPNFIVEILSSSTASIDKNIKKEIYQNTFRTPNYFWFDPNTYELKGFHLVDGLYQPLLANEQGHLWSEELELYLGVSEGVLRFFTFEGQLVPMPEEKVERLAAKLRELNIDPHTL